MPVISIKKRKSTNQLGSLLKSLYEDVLLLCENDEIKLKNDTKDKRWKQFVKSGDLQILNSHTKKQGKFKSYKIDKKDVLVIDPTFLKDDISNTIIFTNVKKKLFSSLLQHIRNAFAHNQIFIDENNGEVIMYDMVNVKSDKFTMVAHLKVVILEELIKIIKLMNKIYENN